LDNITEYKLINKLNNMQSEIIATIDELNQYLNGNITNEAVVAALEELLTKLK
jgi:hypothetical protein